MRKHLFSCHPVLYALRVGQRRLFRRIAWRFSSRVYSLTRLPEAPLPFRYVKHTSKLIRKLGESDRALQDGKIVNLRIAVGCVDGALIRPGEYFSFCRLVGKPTAERGFVAGMELSMGEARAGIGGGLCQLSNLIHWMALHSPLVVVERANHSFDPFPDDGRVLPYGAGAAIFYNFIDLVLHNPTDRTFQICCRVGEHQLEGDLRCAEERDVVYHVYQKNHRFLRVNGRVCRKNEIWRDIHTKGHAPKLIASERLYANRVVVKYPVDEAMLEHASKLQT